MKNRPVEAILTDIGAIINDMGENGYSSYFLFYQMQTGVYSPSLYQDRGDLLAYLDTDPLRDVFHELWYNFEGEWSELIYRLDGTEFTASFNYEPMEIEFDDDRAIKAVRAQLGNKPILYPPVKPGDEPFLLRPDP